MKKVAKLLILLTNFFCILLNYSEVESFGFFSYKNNKNVRFYLYFEKKIRDLILENSLINFSMISIAMFFDSFYLLDFFFEASTMLFFVTKHNKYIECFNSLGWY